VAIIFFKRAIRNMQSNKLPQLFDIGRQVIFALKLTAPQAVAFRLVWRISSSRRGSFQHVIRICDDHQIRIEISHDALALAELRRYGISRTLGWLPTPSRQRTSRSRG
jgi:hypothetical protein